MNGVDQTMADFHRDILDKFLKQSRMGIGINDFGKALFVYIRDNTLKNLQKFPHFPEESGIVRTVWDIRGSKFKHGICNPYRQWENNFKDLNVAEWKLYRPFMLLTDSPKFQKARSSQNSSPNNQLEVATKERRRFRLIKRNSPRRATEL